MASGESKNKQNEPLETAKEAVEELYSFRDNYFQNNSLDKASQKGQDVAAMFEKTLAVLETLAGEISNKAQYCMLKGKAYNVQESFSKDALENLSKAVKLDPKLVEAWIHLGECYWKNKEVEAAKNCFMGALNHAKDKRALRNLSMVLRQLGKDQTEKLKLTEESVDKAKEAVSLDIKDGTSWLILGNAYLSQFFATTQNPSILTLCMKAYMQAEKDAVATTNPDLHFNRSMVYKYQEDYEQSLIGFARASALDPSWTEPQDRESLLLKYLTDLQTLIQAKGKLRAKKVDALIKELKASDFGPYGGGSYTSPHNKTVTLKPVDLQDLKANENQEVVVCAKVVCSVPNNDPVPFTCCILDKQGTCMGVTVYNVASDFGIKIGDSIAIPEPYVQKVNFKYKDKEYNYSSIRVDAPVVLVVNGRKLGVEKQAPTVLAASVFSD